MAGCEILLVLVVALIPNTQASYNVCALASDMANCARIEASRDEIKCLPVADSVDCILKLQKGLADIGSFAPEEGLLAAQFIGSDVDVVAEIRHPDQGHANYAFQTVVIVKANFGTGLNSLFGLKYCHPGFERGQSWTDRVFKYFEKKVLETQESAVPCNSDERNAYEDEAYRLVQIFKKSCRPGDWTINDFWDVKLKKDYPALCALCDNPAKCSYDLIGSGDHFAALRCLTNSSGDVAYTTLQFVQEYFNLNNTNPLGGAAGTNASDYRFLCEDGTTRMLASTDPCAWVKQPLPVVVAQRNISSNASINLDKWLAFPSEVGEKWLMSVKAVLSLDRGNIHRLPGVTPLGSYIKRGKDLYGSRKCQALVRWCVVGTSEKKKCEFIRAVSATHGIPGQVECVPSASPTECMKKIQDNEADVAVIDTQHGFIARKVYNLTTSLSLEGERKSNYYGVIVVKKESVFSKLEQLRGRKACFPQYNTLGWLSFVQNAKKLSLVPGKLCSDTRSVWEYFSSACAPGALSPQINPQYNITPSSMCSVCSDRCRTAPSSPKEGEIAALKCLESDTGDVAFLDFYTVKQYLESDQNKSTPEELLQINEFSLMCSDGSVRSFNMTPAEVEECSITQFHRAEFVSRKNMSKPLKRDIQLTIQDIDEWFGTTYINPVLKMYEAFDGEDNVIFKNTTIRVVTIHDKDNRFIVNYMDLHKNMEQCYRDNGAALATSSIFIIAVSLVLLLLEER